MEHDGVDGENLGNHRTLCVETNGAFMFVFLMCILQYDVSIPLQEHRNVFMPSRECKETWGQNESYISDNIIIEHCESMKVFFS